jgi:hypothetical protein
VRHENDPENAALPAGGGGDFRGGSVGVGDDPRSVFEEQPPDRGQFDLPRRPRKKFRTRVVARAGGSAPKVPAVRYATARPRA